MHFYNTRNQELINDNINSRDSVISLSNTGNWKLWWGLQRLTNNPYTTQTPSLSKCHKERNSAAQVKSDVGTTYCFYFFFPKVFLMEGVVIETLEGAHSIGNWKLKCLYLESKVIGGQPAPLPRTFFPPKTSNQNFVISILFSVAQRPRNCVSGNEPSPTITYAVGDMLMRP